jgi:hypothetical protein
MVLFQGIVDPGHAISESIHVIPLDMWPDRLQIRMGTEDHQISGICQAAAV